MIEPRFIDVPTDRSGGRIMFGAVGDICFLRTVAKNMAEFGVDWPFEKMHPELSQADILFGNMEAVLVPADYDREGIVRGEVISPLPGDKCASALKRAGFDFLNLAANHVLDAGTVGLEYTEKTLGAAGIVTGGVGRTQEEARQPVVLNAGGLRIGLLCYCEDNNYTLGTRGPCHAYYVPSDVLVDIRELRPHVDIVIVSVHADLEFMPAPSVPRRAAFRSFAEAGADLILGHHPHVAQGCERIGKALIVYSLGNFVFPMRQSGGDSSWSFLLRAELSANGVENFERIPFAIGTGDNERPSPCQSADRDQKLARLEQLDEIISDDEEMARIWRETAIKKLESELKWAMLGSNQSVWMRRLTRFLIFGAARKLEIDVERILNEIIGRWFLTAENRAWIDEIFRLGEERWDARNSLPPDPLHRPHRLFQKRTPR